MDLLSAWQKWEADGPPYMLEADADVLKSYTKVVYRSWDEARQHFPETDKKRLHLGLIPGPFMGDMEKASIYVLMNHPGIDKCDYYWEYEVPAFRRAILANLRQERLKGVLPFPCLDPQFKSHPGFKYWHRKLKNVIMELAKARKKSCEEVYSELGEKFAVVQLFPYHCAELYGKWLSDLPSVRLAGEFVKETVVKRVRAKQAIVIVHTQRKERNLESISANDPYGGTGCNKRQERGKS